MALLSAVPPAPRVPSERARRLIFTHQGGPRIRLEGAAALALLGAILLVGLCPEVPGDLGIELGARAVEGRVISARVDPSYTWNDAHPTLVRFAYEAGGRRLEAESAAYEEAILRRAQPGSAIAVEVASFRPEWARIAGTTRNPLGYGPLLALGFPAAAAVLAFTAIRSRRRRVRAFTFGTAVHARVMGVGEDPSSSRLGRHPWGLWWEFHVGGRRYLGTLQSMDRRSLEELAGEKEFVVLYDPADPAASTPWVP